MELKRDFIFFISASSFFLTNLVDAHNSITNGFCRQIKHIKKELQITLKFFTGFRRPSTLPGSFPPSTIDRSGLNRRVRNGNGCVPWAHHHRKYVIIEDMHLQNRIQSNFHHKIFIRSSPRSISIGQLNTLLCLHLQPIYLIIFKGSYFRRMGNLILRAASRLDAFSVYPFHT